MIAMIASGRPPACRDLEARDPCRLVPGPGRRGRAAGAAGAGELVTVTTVTRAISVTETAALPRRAA